MTKCVRIAGLSAALALVCSCSHKGESEPPKAVEQAPGQVGAEAGTSEPVRVRPPVEEKQTDSDDITGGARHYECSNGKRFSVDFQDGGALVTSRESQYFMPKVTKARYTGDEGELRITSPSQTSLTLNDQGAWRSCVREPYLGSQALY
jgi:hypothetical protein